MTDARAAFHAAVTPGLFRGSLPDWQREPLDAILDEGIARGRRLVEVAYVMATAYWETGRFKHMTEIDDPAVTHKYEQEAWLNSREKVAYYGRGFVQLTWLGNYMRMSLLLGVDLVTAPDRAKEPDLAAKILWEGMIRGTFTGKNLADYFGGDEADYVEARRIVNGTDKAEGIADIAREFEAALAPFRTPGAFTPARRPCPLGRGDCPGVAA